MNKKKSKRTKVIFKEATTYYSEYSCPHCHVYLIGSGIKKNVTRFLCEKCGNEVIVDNE